MPPHLDQLSDWDLIQLCLAGNDSAWRLLFTRHESSLIRSIQKLLHKKRLPMYWKEDIFQNVWLTLSKDDYQRLGRYTPRRGHLNTFLKAVAKEEIEIRRRAEGYWIDHKVPLQLIEPQDPGADDARAQAELAEFFESLTPQEKRYWHENVMGEPRDPSTPPISAGNERQLKHCMRRKWDTYLGDRGSP